MKCPRCNTVNNYYHAYCHHCGQKLQEQGLQEEAQQTAHHSGTAKILLNKTRGKPGASRRKPVSKLRVFVLVNLIIVALVLVYFGLVWALGNKSVVGPAPTVTATTPPSPNETAKATNGPTAGLHTVALKLAQTSVKTSVGDVTLSGTATAGAEITANLAGTQKTVAKEDGTFELKLKLPAIPDTYTVAVFAEVAGVGKTTAVCTINRQMNDAEYQNAAMDMNFDDVVAHTDTYLDKVLKTKGRIIAVTRGSDNVWTFTLKIEDSDEQLMKVTYGGITQITLGATIQLFGEVTEVKNNIPQIFARVVLRKIT